MAEIVILSKWRSEKPRRPQTQPQISIGEVPDAGRVVLFTGVRYERYEIFEDRGDRKAENHAVGAE